MKKEWLLFMFFLLSSVANAYDFSTVCSTGQTLYYNVIDADSLFVCVTYPGSAIDSAYDNADRPTGDLIIPSCVNNTGQDYIVTAISTHAFAKCTGLNGKIEIPSTVKHIGSYAFLNCGNITMIQFNAEACTEAYAAFEGCSFDTIVIGDSVRIIPEAIFTNSIGIEAVHLPEKVEIIEPRAFYNCPNLRLVTFGESLRTIGDYAFSDCPVLESISPLNATIIGDYAFYGDMSLSDVVLLDGVTQIGTQAFFNCLSIRSLQIGANVDSIKNYAFYRCNSIDTVFCHANEPPLLEDFSFPENLEGRCLIVPCESVELYESLSGWNLFGNILADKQMRLTVTPNNYNFGYVVSSDTLFCEGSYGIIEAVPYDTYIFQNWNDGNTDNPREILMLNDTVFRTVFVDDTIATGISDYYVDMISVIVNGNNIIVSSLEPTLIQIFDLCGRRIYRSQCKEQYRQTELSTGVYLVAVGEDYRKKIFVK